MGTSLEKKSIFYININPGKEFLPLKKEPLEENYLGLAWLFRLLQLKEGVPALIFDKAGTEQG